MVGIGGSYGLETRKANGLLSLPLVRAKASVGIDVEGINALERVVTRGVIDLYMPNITGI
ncbi:hypothetical protein [Pseudorhodoferax sp.]|uniref:hypothetical protein n=1 Tax=Pseudorhodoferax sp. TaxID=1993553 RepID=UPI0039E5169E